MVSAKNAIRHAGFIEDTHGFVCVFPLIKHIVIVNNVAGMHDILDSHVIRVIDNPLVHIQEMVLPFLGIILGIGFPRETEIIIFGNRVAVPVCVRILLAVRYGIQIRQSGIGSTLNDDGCLPVLYMIFRDKRSFFDRAIGICRRDSIPSTI